MPLPAWLCAATALHASIFFVSSLSPPAGTATPSATSTVFLPIDAIEDSTAAANDVSERAQALTAATPRAEPRATTPSSRLAEPRQLKMAPAAAVVDAHDPSGRDPAPHSNDFSMDSEILAASYAGPPGGGLTSAGAGKAGGSAPAGSPGESGTLSHGPRLVRQRNVCRGLFPHQASHESGSVVVSVEVTPEGNPHSPRITLEAPRGEGFAQAAQTCVPRLHFVPATDAAGRPVASRSKVRLRFDRTL